MIEDIGVTSQQRNPGESHVNSLSDSLTKLYPFLGTYCLGKFPDRAPSVRVWGFLFVIILKRSFNYLSIQFLFANSADFTP